MWNWFLWSYSLLVQNASHGGTAFFASLDSLLEQFTSKEPDDQIHAYFFTFYYLSQEV